MATIHVTSGHTSSGLIADQVTDISVDRYGTIIDAMVKKGGIVDVHGTADKTTIDDQGQQIIFSGGTASGTNNRGGYETVSSGGTTIGAKVFGDGVFGNGSEYIYAGGTASGITVDSGGSVQVSGGVADGTTLHQGFQDVYSGGLASGTVISNNGIEYLDGGTDTRSIVANGGQEEVDADGEAWNTTIKSGGLESVDSGGEAVLGTVDAGGSVEVASGGLAFDTTVEGAIQVDNGGRMLGTIINNGGTAVIEWVGRASGTVISDGGTETVFGTDSGATIDGGHQYVTTGGLALGAIVEAGGYQYVYSGGTANGTIDLNGGTDYVESGGTSSNTTVDSGGTEMVGFFFIGVFNAGSAVDTVVNEGGVQDVLGTAIGTTLRQGDQDVFTGGTASGTIISSGGIETVNAGGTANGATINGGELVLSSGATAGSSTITFDGGGTLKLEASQSYGILVAGFTSPSDVIDLSTVNFATASKSFAEGGNNSSGILTLTDGTNTASLTLMGQYMAGNFSLSQESGGTGTLVTFQPQLTHVDSAVLAAAHPA